MFDPDSPTIHQDLVDLIGQLVSSWDDYWAESSTITVRRRPGQPPNRVQQFAFVFGLCRHAHETARLLLPAVTRDIPPAAAPLVRSVYECGLRAQWLSIVPDAAAAMANVGVNDRRKLRETMGRAQSAVFREGAARVSDADLAALDTYSRAQADYVEQMCTDLQPGGADAYALYRVLSMTSHAGAFVVDSYLSESPAPEIPFALRDLPASAPITFLHIVGSGLVWAGRALAYFDEDRARRSAMRDAARQLGITSELRLSEAYYARIRKARSAHRK